MKNLTLKDFKSISSFHKGQMEKIQSIMENKNWSEQEMNEQIKTSQYIKSLGRKPKKQHSPNEQLVSNTPFNELSQPI